MLCGSGRCGAASVWFRVWMIWSSVYCSTDRRPRPPDEGFAALIFQRFRGHESAAAEHVSHPSLAQVFLPHKAFWVVGRSLLLCSRCFTFGPQRFKLCTHTLVYACVCEQMNLYFGVFLVEGLRCTWLIYFWVRMEAEAPRPRVCGSSSQIEFLFRQKTHRGQRLCPGEMLTNVHPVFKKLEFYLNLKMTLP